MAVIPTINTTMVMPFAGILKQVLKTGGYLLNPQAERGSEPKHPCEYRKRINDMAGPAPDAVTEQWMEHRADGEG